MRLFFIFIHIYRLGILYFEKPICSHYTNDHCIQILFLCVMILRWYTQYIFVSPF